MAAIVAILKNNYNQVLWDQLSFQQFCDRMETKGHDDQ